MNRYWKYPVRDHSENQLLVYSVLIDSWSLPPTWLSVFPFVLWWRRITTEPSFLALVCFALCMQVLFTIMMLWVAVTMGRRVAAAIEWCTLVKGICLCLFFTNSVITHPHFPSVFLSSKSDFNFSGPTFCPNLSQPKGLPGLQVYKDHNSGFAEFHITQAHRVFISYISLLQITTNYYQ